MATPSEFWTLKGQILKHPDGVIGKLGKTPRSKFLVAQKCFAVAMESKSESVALSSALATEPPPVPTSQTMLVRAVK
eukprot:16443388-Heterocapsa_arctica.AAC.1